MNTQMHGNAKISTVFTFARERDDKAFKVCEVPQNTVDFNFLH